MGFLLITATVCALAGLVLVNYVDFHPSSKKFLAKEHTASLSVPLRMAQATLLQTIGLSPVCDTHMRAAGKHTVLLTGGNGGIGYETAKGLVLRGSDVIITCRTDEKCKKAVQSMNEELNMKNKKDLGKLDYRLCDLSDMKSVVGLVEALKQDRVELAQVIFNAAVWPNVYAESRQGYEIAFATNVLGNFLLARKLMEHNVLPEGRKMIFVSGDIYITVAGTPDDGCSSNFKYDSLEGGQTAYSRSKLGLHWMVNELHRRYPSYTINTVHPGVVANGLTGDAPDLPSFVLVSNEEGAQASLIVSTGDTVNGAYYHNTLGRVHLPDGDPANDKDRGQELWKLLEAITEEFMATLVIDEA